MNVGGGVTTERRTRISQPADGSARCRGSRVPGRPSDSCPSTRPPTTPSTFSAISPPPARTEASELRPCRRGVRLLLWREPDRLDALPRLLFVNVTKPPEGLALLSGFSASTCSVLGRSRASCLRRRASLRSRCQTRPVSSSGSKCLLWDTLRPHVVGADGNEHRFNQMPCRALRPPTLGRFKLESQPADFFRRLHDGAPALFACEIVAVEAAEPGLY